MRSIRRILSGFFVGFYWPIWNLKNRIGMARLIARLQGRREALRFFIHGAPTPWG